MSTTTKRDQRLEAIAKTMLDIPTLETRKSDSLDFHEVSVCCLKEALEAAYQAGQEATRQPKRGA
jgi:hypothetical protein